MFGPLYFFSLIHIFIVVWQKYFKLLIFVINVSDYFQQLKKLLANWHLCTPRYHLFEH